MLIIVIDLQQKAKQSRVRKTDINLGKVSPAFAIIQFIELGLIPGPMFEWIIPY
jgi:hypothetical protein